MNQPPDQSGPDRGIGPVGCLLGGLAMLAADAILPWVVGVLAVPILVPIWHFGFEFSWGSAFILSLLLGPFLGPLLLYPLGAWTERRRRAYWRDRIDADPDRDPDAKPQAAARDLNAPADPENPTDPSKRA